MKIVAFLQNQWFNDPAKVERMLAKDTTGKLRQRIITYSLFAGCLTGKRLQQRLGEGLCEQIVWEECSPVICGRASACPPPDLNHIKQVLERETPDLVVCFSKLGEPSVRACWKGDFIACCHPAARHPKVMDDLMEAAVAIKQTVGRPFPAATAAPTSTL